MRYFQRSVKYFLSLCVAYLLATELMWRLGMSLLSPRENVLMLLNTQRGVFMLVAVVALAATYPYFGFMRKRTYGNIVLNREAIIEVMMQSNFELLSEKDGSMTFIGNNFLKRLGMLFEDHIVVSRIDGNEEKIHVAGNRKAIAYILYRLEAAIDRAAEVNKEINEVA